jgi:hypothetical protein
MGTKVAPYVWLGALGLAASILTGGCSKDPDADNSAALPPPPATAPVASPESRAAEARANRKSQSTVSEGAERGDGR